MLKLILYTTVEHVPPEEWGVHFRDTQEYAYMLSFSMSMDLCSVTVSSLKRLETLG